MASSYDNQSFLSGIAVGRQLKGWSAGEGSGGGSGANTGVVIVPELSVQYEACYIMPVPIICTVMEA